MFKTLKPTTFRFVPGGGQFSQPDKSGGGGGQFSYPHSFQNAKYSISDPSNVIVLLGFGRSVFEKLMTS